MKSTVVFGTIVLSMIVFAVHGQDNSHLLPNTSRPLHYYLDLTLTLPSEYYGRVRIDIEVLNVTNQIILHSTNIQCSESDDCSIRGDDVESQIIASEPDDFQFVTLELNEALQPGLYQLDLGFADRYFTFSQGLFQSSYRNSNQDTRYVIATQFEPAHARRLFPSYDEPNLKAYFTVTITHPVGYYAVSNSPVESVRNISATETITEFKTTPPMSTYLLALTLTDYIEAHTIAENSGTEVGIYADTNKAGLLEFPLVTSALSVYYLNELTGVNYILPKLDGFCIEAFGGGMENWGLIIYDNSILRNASTITQAQKRSATNLISHEIAHQWFGNLVTLDWWDYLWLNEAFATYYAQLISDKIAPELRFLETHVVGLQSILRNEETTANPWSLNQAVKNPNEYSNKFNYVSYNKGSAIVRMMNLVFPEYHKGITEYLEKTAFGSSTPTKLFTAIQNQPNGLSSDLSVNQIMNSWSNLGRYPLLTVEVSERSIKFSQEEFRTSGTVDPTKLWFIPLTVATEHSPDFENTEVHRWLPDTEQTLTINTIRIDGWVIVNVQNAAFLRVNYDSGNWRKISAYLNGPNFEKIHVLNRAQLVADATNLQKAGKLNSSIALELLAYLEQETDGLVKQSGRVGLLSFANNLKNTEVYGKYKKFVSGVLGEDEAAELLQEANFQALAESVLETKSSRKGLRERYAEAFDVLAQRVNNFEDYNKVRNFMRLRARSEQEDKYAQEILEDLKLIAEVNEQSQSRFLANDYKSVEQWLASKGF